MAVPEPKFRKALNEDQLLILKVLFKFRFATTALLHKRQSNKSEKAIYYKFQRLLDQGYIGRKYDGKAKISGKPAIYYLLPKGIKVLKEKTDFNPKSFNNLYKNKTVSSDFIDHCLDIFDVYDSLKNKYGDKLTFLSRSELYDLENLPKRLPDAYLVIKNKEYYLEVVDSKIPFFVIRQKINDYIKQCDSDEWDSENYPTILIVCENRVLERQILNYSVRRAKISGSNLEMVSITNDDL